MKKQNITIGLYPQVCLLAASLVMAPLTSIAAEQSESNEHSHSQNNLHQQVYACPMHPEETSNQPKSRCPQCNMFLTPVEQDTDGSHRAHQHSDVSKAEPLYACPMHPEETSNQPKSRCPQCNMFLTPVEQDTGGSHQDHQHSDASKAEPLYACPMHPEETSNQPKSRCPQCNMFLTPVAQDTGSSHQDHSQHTSTNQPTEESVKFQLPQAKPALETDEVEVRYVCPMHAHIISDEPSSCPICGMNLERVEVGGNQSEIEISVSGSMQQALALKVATAEKDTLWKFVQTVGQIEYDESQINHIHARVSGWIENLTIESVGDRVKKGQLLYELYSPDLVNAQDDYLLAQDSLQRTANTHDYHNLLKKAELRLKLLGLSQQQIKRLSDSKQTLYRVPFYASGDGIIKQLNVRDGMYIKPETELMSVVNLDRVWVIADVFENEQSWLTTGQTAKISVPAMGISDIEGEIDYIYPELDPTTRSMRVRIIVDNPQANLRPNTLAKISLLGGPNQDVLVIPQEALIQTGQENRVIVKLDDNSFTARQVSVGMLSQGKAEIVYGLKQGEQVVISGQFLLDSEASLKGSIMRLSSSHQH